MQLWACGRRALISAFAAIVCLTSGTMLGQTISGNIINDSDWLNDTGNVPPHWYVAASAGVVSNAHGRLVVNLIDEFDNIVSQTNVAPSDGVSVTNLASIMNMTFPYALGNGLWPGDYQIYAWIDGNSNWEYDLGEPFGSVTRTISGDSDIAGVTIRIVDDSDGDGLEDWWEIHWFGDLDETRSSDYDNDGLSNGQEYDLIVAGTSIEPDDWDTDGDRLGDGWERFYGFDPTSTAGADGADGDPDGDNLSNLTEYRGPDGQGPRTDSGFGGIAEVTGSPDAMDPTSDDSDDDGALDFDEFVRNLTHPVHPMNSTNYFPRSLDLSLLPAGGVALPDPLGTSFGVPDEGATIEFWIYPEGDGNGNIYDFGGAFANSLRISLEDYRPKGELLMGGVPTATVGGTNNPARGIYGEVAPLATGTWSHVAFVWSPEINSFELYVNGLLLIAKEAFVYPDLSTLANPILVSGITDGYLDDFRFWSYPRTASDIEYWHNRIYPAPGNIKMVRERCSGSTIQTYLYGVPLMAYYRFDDAGDEIEDFAHLNSGLFPVSNTYSIVTNPVAAAVSDREAVLLLGSDDADADGVPEWWNELHRLDRFPEYEAISFGPYQEPCPESLGILAMHYFRSFVAYASIGNMTAWVEDGADPVVFHEPKTVADFLQGHHSSYMRYIYLHNLPQEARLNIHTPGMVSTIVFVNGERLTPVGGEDNTTQSYNAVGSMTVGRNQIYVKCISDTVSSANPSGGRVLVDFDEYLACDPTIFTSPTFTGFLNCEGERYQFEKAVGKFDASLTCDGESYIVRGDQARNDPRSVWYCQTWSKESDRSDGVFPRPDKDNRHLPGNPDWGAINHAEPYNNPLSPNAGDDGLDAFYEYIARTNPRDIDSNNNGIPDGEEDFDGDGLFNLEEQRFGAHPWLPDSDDDGLLDGLDASNDGYPASSLTPRNNLSLRTDGSTNSYVSLPLNRRFALYEWTVEAWINPSTNETDGGIVLQRQVTDREVNYEIGITDTNTVYVRYVPNFGLSEVILTSPTAIPVDGMTWTHVAATYFNRELNLVVNGTNVAVASGLAAAPAVFAGGPVVQRIGYGFNGLIDEVRIWGGERDAEAILSNRDDVLSGRENDLVAYYRFDDGTSFTNNAGSITGTSRNNTAGGDSNVVAWTHGQIEDFVSFLPNDWWQNWTHAASIVGTGVTFSTNAAVVGPPSLQVNIERPSDDDAGARWSVNGGGSWNKSGAILTTLDEGQYTVSFLAIDGWLAPESFVVTLQKGVSTVTNVEYMRPGSIRVELDNVQDVIDEAAWRLIPNGEWNAIGPDGQVDGLTPGVEYFIDFEPVSTLLGYATPTNAPISVTLAEGEERQIVAHYVPITGSIRMFLRPEGEDPETDGRWRPTTDTNWYQNGAVVGDLGFGTHTVQFYEFDASAWTAPANISVDITENGAIVTRTGTYARVTQPTSILVDIAPQGAVTNGAEWRVDAGAWQDSGDFLVVAPGTHTVSFRDLDGWLSPGAVTVAVSEATQTAVSGTYYRVDILGESGTDAGAFRAPRGVAVDLRYVYVADTDNDRIQIYDRTLEFWSALGSRGTGLGQFRQPFGIAVDSVGNVWVADTGNHRLQRRDAVTGAWTAYGSRGVGLGQMNAPYAIAVDANDNVLVADYHNSRILKRTLNGTWSILVRSGLDAGYVRYPHGICVDISGTIFVSDYDPDANAGDRSRVQAFNAAGELIDSVNGVWRDGLSRVFGLSTRDGYPVAADAGASQILEATEDDWELLLGNGAVSMPHDLTFDLLGNLFVADTGNDRVLMIPKTGAPDLSSAWPVPGRVEAEGFDSGGEGVAYHDKTAANEGAAYRPGEGVDIAAAPSASAGHVVGWTSLGEWMTYTVYAAVSNTYTIDLRAAAVGAGGQCRVLVDDVDVSGVITIPDTGAWNSYSTLRVGSVDLEIGLHTVRIEILATGSSGYAAALDWFALEEVVPIPAQTAYPAGTPWILPGTVEVEDFDLGGSSVAYMDQTAANEGGAYRAGESVGIAADVSAGNGHVVGWTRAGEWLEYTVNVTNATNYVLEVRVAAMGAGGQIRVRSNGSDLTGLVNVPDTGGWGTYQTVTIPNVALSAGIQVFRLEMITDGASGFVGAFDWFRVATVAAPSPQSAYPAGTPWAVPGSIEVEDFDLGGSTIAYLDATPANDGGAYRLGEEVDIAADAGAGNGHAVGWTRAGEWLEYTVDVAATGTYQFAVDVAAVGTGGRFRMLVDGVDGTGVLSVPATGGWGTYQTVTGPAVALGAGEQVVRLEMVANGTSGSVGAFDAFVITNAVSGSTQTAYPAGTPWPLPGTVQMENFDQGGAGVAYADSTVANEGGVYRTGESVGIAADGSAGNGYAVGWTRAGEWLEYTVNITQTDSYTLEVYAAALGAGGQFRIRVDGTDVTGVQTIPNTGGWGNYAAQTITGVALTAGERVVRVEMISNGTSGYVGAFDWFRFFLPSSPAPMPAPVFAKAEVVKAPQVVKAITSEESDDPGAGWLALDGDTNTVWEGASDARAWWLVVQYAPVGPVDAIHLDTAADSLTNVIYLQSHDAKNWSNLHVPLTNSVDLEYLWLVFPKDASGKHPMVRELSIDPVLP